MKFDRIKSILGRRLLTVLMVPAILGCNFTAVQTSATEAAAVASTEENGETADNNSDEQQNNDNGSDNGEAAPQDNADGSGEGAGEQGGQDGSEAEDASSTGASTDEGDNTGSGEGASTGASSETAGSDSSTDATSGSSSDAAGSATSGNSDASGSASSGASDASTDASSGASSEDSAEAASSASSEEWKDEDVSENSDVSGNDAEDDAEFFEEEDDVLLDIPVYLIKNYKAVYKNNKLESTDIYFTEDCFKDDVGQLLWQIEKIQYSYEIDYLFGRRIVDEEVSVSGASDSFYHVQILGVEIIPESVRIISCVKNKNGNVISRSYHKANTFEEPKYPITTDLKGYTFHGEYYYVNPTRLKKEGSKLTYCVNNVTEKDKIQVFIKNDTDTAFNTEVIDVKKTKVTKTKGIDSIEFFEPATFEYVIDDYSGDINPLRLGCDSNDDTPEIHMDVQVKTGEEELEQKHLAIDDESPVVHFKKGENPDSETIDDNALLDGNKIYIHGTDPNLKKIEHCYIGYQGNDGVHAPTKNEFNYSLDENATYDVRTIDFCGREPGVYTINDVKVTDYAENTNDAIEKTVVYDPLNPQAKIDNVVSFPNNLRYEDGMVYPSAEEVCVQVRISQGLFLKGEDASNAVQAALKVTRAEDEKSAASDYQPKVEYNCYRDNAHIVDVKFNEEGIYNVSLKADNSGHDSYMKQLDIAGFNIPKHFTIDTAVPVATKKTIKRNRAKHNIYYNDSVIESVVYDKKNISDYITIENNDLGVPTMTPELVFDEDKDHNTIAIAKMDKDGRYSFSIIYKKNGNTVKTDFDTYVIDRKIPDIDFSAVENYSANNGEVAPVITAADPNMDLEFSDLKLVGSNNGNMNISCSYDKSKEKLVIKCEDFAREKALDDLYKLEATVKDLAGNEAKKTLIFSVNRFGSVFVLGDGTKAMNEKYYTNDPQDVTVTEINVDDLIARDISVTRDGSFRKLNNETDYRVSRQGDDTTWKTYTYNVSRNNFDKDGVYSVSLYTKDRATNEMDNKSRNAEIEFAVDRTAPSIVAADIEDKGVYKGKKHEFNVDVTDNMGVVSLTVYNNGKTVQEYTGEQLKADNNIETITLKEGKKLQNITLVALDVAGNKQTVVFKDIVVSAKDAEKIAEEEVEEVEETEAEVIDIPETLGVAKGPEQPVKPEKPQEQLKPVKPEIPVKPGFPYKKAAAAAGAGACVLAAAGAGIIIRRRRKIK